MIEMEPEPGSGFIQALQPITTLSPLRIEELKPLCHMESVPAGMTLFREGEADHQTIYLLLGEVVLSSTANELSCVLTAPGDRGEPDRLFRPIADQQPRRLSAMAITRLDIMRVDSELLDILVTWDALARCQAATSISSGTQPGVRHDWMGNVQQCLAFRSLPAPSLAMLGVKLEPVAVRAGQVVAREGDRARDYYLIENGTATMTRETDGLGPADTTTLGPGAGFGGESLADEECSWQASVAMDTRGTLLRLARADFVDLRRIPLPNSLSPSQALSKTASGAVWLDVRELEESPDSLLPDAHHVPLDTLCQVADSLEQGREYICCCNTGRRSALAAYLLGQRGLDAYVLAGGLRSVPEGFGVVAHDSIPATNQSG